MATTRIVFARDHSLDVDGRIQEVQDKLCEALKGGQFASFPVEGIRIDINPQHVWYLRAVGSMREHQPD
jgi:hypothetical protein